MKVLGRVYRSYSDHGVTQRVESNSAYRSNISVPRRSLRVRRWSIQQILLEPIDPPVGWPESQIPIHVGLSLPARIELRPTRRTISVGEVWEVKVDKPLQRLGGFIKGRAVRKVV